MAVRGSMGTLITRVRTHIADPSGGSAHFTDQDIQDELDRTRDDVRYDALREEPTFLNQTTTWLDYYDPQAGEWESDVTLLDSRFVVLTPATSDLLTGHWTFSATQNPPVFALGKRYDTYLAAAYMAERWAGSYAGAGYDFTADGATFRRSQVALSYLQMASDLRAKARPRMAYTGRSDAW